jgi:hypothetical protein
MPCVIVDISVTTIIAVYGAVVSTFALFLARRDKVTRLRVSSSFGVVTHEPGLQLLLDIVNPGERATTIRCHGFILPDRRKYVTNPKPGAPLPIEIASNSNYMTWTSLASTNAHLRQQRFTGKLRITPFCTDSCERTFTGRAIIVDLGQDTERHGVEWGEDE